MVRATNHPAASAAIRHEWVVYYKVQKYIVEPNFSFLLFFNDLASNPTEWPYYSSSSSLETCPNCQEHNAADTMMSGEVRPRASLGNNKLTMCQQS